MIVEEIPQPLVHKLASFPDSPPEHKYWGEPGNEVVHPFHNTEIAYSMQLVLFAVFSVPEWGSLGMRLTVPVVVSLTLTS